MVLPLFTLYASRYEGATPFSLGCAMGIYGLTQALFQIPFGALSDHIGRKKVIAGGLSIFILGSLIAACATSISYLILGRALQGSGAIGSTLIAAIADRTRETVRTKAMAIMGMTIGLSFSLAMILGPLLVTYTHINGLFALAAGLGLSALGLLLFIPKPNLTVDIPKPNKKDGLFLLKQPELMRLNLGIFLLHCIFTASFVAIPISLQTLAGMQANEQGWIFLSAAAGAFILSIPCIVIAEKKHCVKLFFIAAIVLLGLSEGFLWKFAHNLLISSINVLLFLSAFSLLEAFLPSLVSKTAPSARKGTALGFYSCSQFLGIFAGGALGGWLYGSFGLIEVYLFCGILALIWATIAFGMKNPHYSKQLTFNSQEM